MGSVLPPEGPHSSLRDPPVAGPRRLRRVVLGKLGRPPTTPRRARDGRGMGGHQLKRNSAPPSIRHPPSPPCTSCGCVQPIRAPRWLALSLPPRCCRGRSQASLCCDIFQQPTSRPVRPIRLTWADGNCAGPNILTRVLHPKFSSCRVKRRGTIHPLSLRIPKGLLQPAPPPDGGHRACCCIVPLPERPTGLVRQPIRNERRPVERRASSC